MSAVMTSKHITAQEFRNMAEAGVFEEDERLELVRGKIIQMTPIGPEHAHAVRELLGLLGMIPRELAILDVQNPLLMPDDNELYPDLMVLKPRADNYRALPTAEDVLLVVEVADSSLAYDRSVKVALYAEGGIPELWLVDIRHPCLWIYQYPEAAGYAEVQKLTGDDVVSFHGVQVVLDTLFAD